jgi:Xaa-Pro dipeptidase
MSETNYSLRMSRLALGIQTTGLHALAINPGQSLTYLTGLHFHLSERPVLALFVPHTPPVLVIPELEAAKARHLPFAAQIFAYGEDPARWQEVFMQACLAAGLRSGRSVGYEPRGMRMLEYELLAQAAPGCSFQAAAQAVAALRVRKDASEIENMRKAVQIAQDALEATLPAIKIGASEREIASELTLQVLRRGSDPTLPFAPIVASGPNSANPHATPTDRRLQEGDLLVIDWGAAYDGYFSDLTRTFAVGKVDEEMERIAAIVLEANAAGRRAAGPEALASSLDDAARQVIVQSGYGKYFTHRTGHGLGMESHEEPYIRADNHLPLAPGMTFTVEPGIYLPDRNGVRIEDDMLITESGAESLSDLPRGLRVVG